MKHNEDGRIAEEMVAKYLEHAGYKILDKNWKTRQCEIDIVAEQDNCVHFVEVKFRSNSSRGSGFEYITQAKQRQMRFAADYWVAVNSWEGEYVLSGAEVSGPDFEINFIEAL